MFYIRVFKLLHHKKIHQTFLFHLSLSPQRLLFQVTSLKVSMINVRTGDVVIWIHLWTGVQVWTGVSASQEAEYEQNK